MGGRRPPSGKKHSRSLHSTAVNLAATARGASAAEKTQEDFKRLLHVLHKKHSYLGTTMIIPLHATLCFTESLKQEVGLLQ
jgi:hypothetical protein